MGSDKYPSGKYTAPHLPLVPAWKSPFPSQGINPSAQSSAGKQRRSSKPCDPAWSQQVVKQRSRGRKGHLVPIPSAGRAPQRCSTAPGMGSSSPQTAAIIIIKQLTPITPSSARSPGMDTAQGKFAAASPLHILI